MAGNSNSGNRLGGKSLQDKVRKAMLRAVKQGDEGIAGQRALSELLADLMQSDVAKFMQICAPYMPKEIILDQSISITVALEEARQRVIEGHVIDSPQLIEHQPTIIIPSTDQRDAVSVESSQGEV